MNILVTGGSGYIGSHTIVELLKDKENNIISIDNFSNSNSTVNENILKVAKRKHIFYECDLLNIEEIDKIFLENKIDIVIHFAGLKSVNESVTNPIKYYKNNVTGTLNLLDVMNKYKVKNIIFSSSATVYGNPIKLPIDELARLNTTNPYGRNKLHIENMLEDLIYSDKNWSITILRYFNPIGAHDSGFLGENPNGVPNNIMPFITQVAAGSIEKLNIFGNDYNTKDGTGVRDYIHVVDLANGHKKAVNKTMYSTGLNIYNLGTGKGYSVLELINAFEKVNHIKINYVFTERRSGDVAACFANPTRANTELKWKAKKSIEDMVRDSWNYQKKIIINDKNLQM